ncbi:MAG: argininosuccinate lyase [Candidatus Binatia bacterium]
MRKQCSEAYRGYRTAGIRLTEELVPHASTIRSGMREDLFYAVHAFDKVHLVMMAEEGLIPRADAVAMLRALREMEAQGVPQAREQAGGGQHSGEQFLIRRLGEEVGGRLHLGRSSGDLGVVTNRLRQRDRLLEALESINIFREAVLRRAREHLGTVMPSYTHGRQAQVVTFAFVMLEWASVLERDAFRLRRSYERTNVSGAGTTIGTGTNFPLNRHRTMELLGFDDLDQNALNAHQSRDILFEVFAALAILNANLARWSDDLMFWSTNESAMVDFADRFCGTSSIMMQKKNPYATEITKGGAYDTVAGLLEAFLIGKGPAGMAILDWRFGEAALWRAFDNTLADLRMFTDLTATLTIRGERMREVLGSSWVQATDVAAALVTEKGLSWRSAHQIVGIAARLASEHGILPKDITPMLLDQAAMAYQGAPVRLSQEALQRAMDPLGFVGTRKLYGGPAPEQVEARIDDFAQALNQDQRWLAQARERLQTAAAKLEKAIDALLTSG